MLAHSEAYLTAVKNVFCSSLPAEEHDVQKYDFDVLSSAM
jgi:hypothetical protein